MDLQLRESGIRNLQNELVVVSGTNFSSRINVIKKGISIQDHCVLDSLPAIDSVCGLFTTKDSIIIKLAGMPTYLAAKVEAKMSNGKQGLSITGIDFPQALSNVATIIGLWQITENKLLIVSSTKIIIST